MAALGNALGDDVLRRAFATADFRSAVRPVLGVEEFASSRAAARSPARRWARPCVAAGGDDVICALGGDDVIAGGGGEDVVYGDGGDDRIAGGGGDDTLYGDEGGDNRPGRGRETTCWPEARAPTA